MTNRPANPATMQWPPATSPLRIRTILTWAMAVVTAVAWLAMLRPTALGDPPPTS